MNKVHIDSLHMKGKNVLVRVDFNIPLDSQGNISDNFRIISTIPTIRKIISEGGRVILMSHLKRPGGVYRSEYSLRQIAKKLSILLNHPVSFSEDCLGSLNQISQMKNGEVILLENLRFYPFEDSKIKDERSHMAKVLSQYGKIFINDAFGTSHRAVASMVELPKMVTVAATGYLVAKEIKFFDKVLNKPKHPFVLMLGGKKVSDKIGVINNLIHLVDSILIGGAMAYPFLKAKGFTIGKSYCEKNIKLSDGTEVEIIDLVKDILKKAEGLGVGIITPIDHVVSTDIEKSEDLIFTEDENIPNNYKGFDIGLKTVRLFSSKINSAKMIVWNGPMGVCEKDIYLTGSKLITEAIAKCSGITVVGGGETAEAIRNFGFFDALSHVSTGGGAFLEYLEGKILPGISVLSEN